MEGFIDLQTHTLSSDGELTPEQLVDLAIEKKLKAIAITDHDSVDSVKRGIEYSKGKEIEVVPGIELSCDDPLLDNDKIDILGLFIDPENRGIIDLNKLINQRREENKKEVINRLKNFGYDIEYEDVKQEVKGTFGRVHIAKYLLKKYPDEFSSIPNVFDKLIGTGKKGFIKTTNRVSIKDAVKLIRDAGGLSIMAHPGIYPREESIKLIDHFIESGGDGIETYYPYHIIFPGYKLDEQGNNGMIQFYKDIVKSKKILESGGNDYHGAHRSTLGLVKVPYSILVNLKKALS